MAYTLTPFEEAESRQIDFLSGLLLMHILNDLVLRGEECRKGAIDSALPLRVRTEALMESRNINAALQIVATGTWPGQGMPA